MSKFGKKLFTTVLLGAAAAGTYTVLKMNEKKNGAESPVLDPQDEEDFEEPIGVMPVEPADAPAEKCCETEETCEKSEEPCEACEAEPCEETEEEASETCEAVDEEGEPVEAEEVADIPFEDKAASFEEEAKAFAKRTYTTLKKDTDEVVAAVKETVIPKVKETVVPVLQENVIPKVKETIDTIGPKSGDILHAFGEAAKEFKGTILVSAEKVKNIIKEQPAESAEEAPAEEKTECCCECSEEALAEEKAECCCECSEEAPADASEEVSAAEAILDAAEEVNE